MNPTTDTELMCRVRDGDLSRLGVLFERHHVRLFNFLRRLGLPNAAAEDTTQEVFMRMLKYRHNYRDGGEFVPWMFQMARNAAADTYRKSGRGREVAMAEDAPEPADHRPLVAEDLEQAESAERVRAALDRLPREKRELLLLARFERLHYDEIAGMLGCTVGAVKVRVHRALKELRDAYFGIDANAEGRSAARNAQEATS